MKTNEELLHEIEERAAMLRQLAYSAAQDPSFTPTKNVMNGIGEVCADIERNAERVRKSLNVEALSTQVTRKKEER